MEDSNREKVQNDDKSEVKQQESSISENKNPHFDTSSSDSDFEFEFTCEICNKTFSGLKPLRQHEKGAQHLKRVRKKEAENKLFRKLEEDPAENKEGDLDQALFAVCKTCKKDFMGPESLEQHLKSSSHQKKMAASRLLKDIRDKDGHISLELLKQKRKEKKSKKGIPIVVGRTSDHSVASEPSSGNDGACGYSGPEVVSGVKSSDDSSSEDETIAETQEFECLDCKKVFTGVNPWYQHIVSKVHEKTLKQKELFDKLRIAGASLPNGSSTDQYLVQEEDDVIFCRLCTVAFSGPESASTHLKSKKHTKNLELKKWKKAMKDNRDGMKSSSETKKKVCFTSSVEYGSEVRRKVNEQETIGSEKDGSDKQPSVEFSFRHDGYKSVSKMKSSPTVEKGTYLEPSKATGDSSEEGKEIDQHLENYNQLQNQLASSPTCVNDGPSEETRSQNKNNLQSFKETYI